MRISVLLLSLLCVACLQVTFVEAGEPDPSFQNSLNSFINSLFGSSNSSSTETTASTVSGNSTTAAPESRQEEIATNDTTTAGATVNNGTVNINETTSTDRIQVNQTTKSPTQNETGLIQINPNTTKVETLVSTNAPETRSSTFSWPSTYSSLTSSTMASAPKEDEFNNPSQCYEGTEIQKFCSAPSDLTDVTFWDLYSTIFSDSVVNGLMMECKEGVWCLKDKYDYWDALIAERVDIITNSEIVNSMCQPGVLGCIDNMADFFKDCSFYYQMSYTSISMDLICKLKKNSGLKDACYKHVLEALHVSLADLARVETDDDSQGPVDTCESPAAYMTQGLICVANSCPGEADTFKSFRPWLWFTAIVDELITECDYNTTNCVALLQKPMGYVEPEDLQMMIIISVSTMVTAIVLSLTVCLCYRRYRRNAVIKDGYQQLLNDGDES